MKSTVSENVNCWKLVRIDFKNTHLQQYFLLFFICYLKKCLKALLDHFANTKTANFALFLKER